MAVIARAGVDALLAGLDCLRVGLVILDAEDRVAYCNDHFRYLFASTRGLDAVVDASYPCLLRQLRDAGEFGSDAAVTDPDGWLASLMAHVRSEGGRPLIERLADGRWMEIKTRQIEGGGSIVHWNDVSALMRTQLRFEAAIESAADGFAIWDQNDRLVLHNEVFARMHRVPGGSLTPGMTFQEFVEQTADSGLFDETVPREKWIARRLEKHALPVGQSTLRHCDGRWFLMRDRRTHEGGRVTVYTNITELKERERQLIERGRTLQHTVQELAMNQAVLQDHASNLVTVAEQLEFAKAAAERANESKTAFLRNMSHELRTPLNSIIGFSEVLGQEMFGPLGNERYLEYVEMINSSGSHLLTLINEILDLSKIEAGRYELVRDVFDLREIVRECCSLMASQIASEKLTLETELPATPLDIDADQTAIRQVVLNVISNAVKFTEPGGTVAVRLAAQDGLARLVVADTGIGIAPKDLGRVMIPFEQVDTGIAADRKGTGLGLPIVKSLVELHGGSVELVSTLGRGTTLTIWLPQEACAVAALETAGSGYGLISSPA